MPASVDILYLFTTAANSKPTYRRGVLDLLTYPAGHVLPFSYRRSDIADPVDSLIAPGRETPAVVVFVDFDPKLPTAYLPLRRVSILEVSPPLRPGSTTDPEERIEFFLRLEEYIEYNPAEDFRQWHNALTALDTAREVKGNRARYFVVAGRNVFDPPRGQEQLNWENLVKAVAESTRFGDSIFLRLGRVAAYGSGRNDAPLNPYREGRPRTYLLRPGHAYQLDFDVYVKPGTAALRGRSPKVTVTSSSELIITTKPFQSVVSGLVQQSAIISCKRTIEDTRAALTVEIDEPIPDVVNTPGPVLLLDLSVPRWVVVGFCILVFLGSLLVSSDKETWAELVCSAAVWTWLAKIAGSGLLAVAAFMAFRKLPAGQG